VLATSDYSIFLSFLLGGVVVCLVINVIITTRVERAVTELRAAIERLITVETTRKL